MYVNDTLVRIQKILNNIKLINTGQYFENKNLIIIIKSTKI